MGFTLTAEDRRCRDLRVAVEMARLLAYQVAWMQRNISGERGLGLGRS